MGANCAANRKFFERVNMYVYEEIIEGRKLTEIINEDHENVKYLPGHKLGSNVVSFFLNYGIHKFFKMCSLCVTQCMCNSLGYAAHKSISAGGRGTEAECTPCYSDKKKTYCDVYF